MRAAMVVLVLAGCRQALGIPSGGGEDVPGFAIHVDVQGATGASGGAMVSLHRSGSDDVTVESLLDDTTVLASTLDDGEDFELVPMSGNCRIAGGAGTIDGGDATGTQITCDGLAALDDFGFSAPITFEPAFDGSIDAPRPLASIIVQQTAWAPVVRHAGAAVSRISYAGQVAGAGPFPIVPGTAWGVELGNAGFARTYTADPVLAPPTAFGYGKPATVEPGAGFGTTLAAVDAELAVGSPDAPVPSVVAFRRTGRAWTELQRLTGEPGTRFGAAIAMTATTLAIAEPGTKRVRVYARTSDMWIQTGQLTATDATTSFGTAIAIQSASVIFVGDPACRGRGCVFRYTDLAQTAVLDAGREGDELGAALAVTATHLAVGMPGDDSAIVDDPTDTQFADAGAVRVFALSDLGTSTYLKAEAPGVGDRFGASVAIDGAFLVVGAPLDDAISSDPEDNSATGAGAAYVFQLASTWIQTAFVKAPNAGIGDNFGRTVAIKSNRIGTAPATCVLAIGAPFEDSGDPGDPDDESAPDAGAVFVYHLTADGRAVEPTYGKALNTGAFDGFGLALALTAESLIAGAPFEDSSQPGWNATGNEAAHDSGAVYSLR
ncbi:MAG: FG-GAP repeat protein [Kofleriaceae bacterium]